MIIKSGDYVESLHGNVGVVKTVGKTVPVDGKEQFSFDWEITRPSIGSGGRGFFAGSESDLWRHYRQIGMYHRSCSQNQRNHQPSECGGMLMEHIVQFGINIDDEAIKRAVMESGVKTIEAQIKQAIINKVFTAYRYGNANPASDPLSTWAQNLVADTLAENRDAIISQAAAILADKMGRSVKVREAIIAKAAE